MVKTSTTSGNANNKNQNEFDLNVGGNQVRSFQGVGNLNSIASPPRNKQSMIEMD